MESYDARDMLELLNALWYVGNITTKSDTARSHADTIPIASALGFITTSDEPSNDPTAWGRTWRLTPSGISKLWELYQNE